jgi:hypothetical protein
VVFITVACAKVEEEFIILEKVKNIYRAQGSSVILSEIRPWRRAF